MQAPQVRGGKLWQWLQRPRGRVASLLCAIAVSACGGGSSDSSHNSAPVVQTPLAGFSVDLSPASAVAYPGSGRMLRVTLKRTGGFSADVTVGLSAPPEGVTAEAIVFSGTAATATVPLPVSLTDEVAPGNLALAFNASGGGISANASIELAVQAAQPPAQQKIAAALAAGSIDRDTALLYRLYVLAGDPRLPGAYIGSGSDEEDLRLFMQVEAAWPQMSAAMQTMVHPFMVRPDHPDSVYRRPGTTARSSRLSVTASRSEKAAAPPSTCVAGAQWRSIRSATIPVRVWSECYDDVDETLRTSNKAQATLEVFEKIWTPMTTLMGLQPRLDIGAPDNGGDEAIDVYLVTGYSLSRDSEPINIEDLGTAYGFARPAGPCVKNAAGNDVCSGYMVLSGPKAGTQLQRSTIIHEFFHVLQFAHNKTLAEFPEWFYEASARWVESHFDRVLDWPAKVAFAKVHRPWFKTFLAADEAVNSSAGSHPYASYIWPFFLEQETGGIDIIGRIWTALGAAKTAADEDRIVDEAYAFDTNFHRFALRNVNEELLPGDPLPKAKRYVSLAGDSHFPDGSVKPRYVTSTLSAGSEETRHYGIEPWSAEYAQFLVNGDAQPNRVEFDFSGLSGRGSLKLDALVRTSTGASDEWVGEPISLNPDAKAIFCFDLGKSTTTVRGEFKELRLVLSNSASNLRIGGDVIVRPTKKPCGVWEGTIESTQKFTLPVGTLEITSSAQMAFAFDEANSDSVSQAFQVRAGSYTYSAYYDFAQRNPPCRTVQTAAGSMHPQGESMDLSDGSTAGALATFVSSDGRPQYTNAGVLTFTTLTEVSNCNGRNVDMTTLLPMSTMALWVLEQQVYDIKQNGTTMQDIRSTTTGSATSKYTWMLTKKTE